MQLKIENQLVSYRGENLLNPKIGQKYYPDIQNHPATRDPNNTLQIPEQYHKNTNFVFWGHLKGYFGESLFCMLGGIFEFLDFPICSWSMGSQFLKLKM